MKKTFIFGFLAILQIVFGWADQATAKGVHGDEASPEVHSDRATELLDLIGSRRYYAKCPLVLDATKELIAIEGDEVVASIVEVLRTQNRRCLLPLAEELLRRKNAMALPALLFYMDPEGEEDLGGDENYYYYRKIIEKLSKRPFKTGGDWKKLVEWWEMTGKKSGIQLTQEVVDEIFGDMRRNRERRQTQMRGLERHGIEPP